MDFCPSLSGTTSFVASGVIRSGISNYDSLGVAVLCKHNVAQGNLEHPGFNSAGSLNCAERDFS